MIGRPFAYEELLARIRALLRRSTPASSEVIVAGDLVIDRPTRRVHVRDTSVLLSAKEFELVAKLASEPQRVFTKEELLREVWGYRALGRTRTLGVPCLARAEEALRRSGGSVHRQRVGRRATACSSEPADRLRTRRRLSSSSANYLPVAHRVDEPRQFSRMPTSPDSFDVYVNRLSEPTRPSPKSSSSPRSSDTSTLSGPPRSSGTPSSAALPPDVPLENCVDSAKSRYSAALRDNRTPRLLRATSSTVGRSKFDARQRLTTSHSLATHDESLRPVPLGRPGARRR